MLSSYEASFQKAIESGPNCYEQVKYIAYSYAFKQELSLQEAVYHIIPELWTRKIFPGVLNTSSSTPLKSVRMVLLKNKLLELPEEEKTLLCIVPQSQPIGTRENIKRFPTWWTSWWSCSS